MRYLVLLGVFFSLLAASPLAAQTDDSDSGHVYVLTYWKTLPGQSAAYNTFIREHSLPYYDETVKIGPMVSYRFVALGVGSGDYSHVFIAEYENWDAADDPLPEGGQAAACQAAFQMTCAAHAENYPDLGTVRVFVRREILFSVR